MATASLAEIRALAGEFAAWVEAKRKELAKAASASWKAWCEKALDKGAGGACRFAREELPEPLEAISDRHGR